jgi:SAM-dependent methyltransferase
LAFKDRPQISDVKFETRYSNSYASISEKNSRSFNQVMNKLLNYIGTGPIGPNKYWEYPWILSNLRLERGMSILDAGCGKSPIQFLLHDLGCEVSGIDHVENVNWHGIDRRLSDRFGCDIDYRKESIESMSFKDDTFDRICCVSVIEHCRAKNAVNEKLSPQTTEDRKLQRKLIREMIRVLKPGGLLVFTVDFNIPRDDCILESNVNVQDLISVNGSEIYGVKCPDLLPGEKGFNVNHLVHNSDIDIVNYGNTLQTSIGITLLKK